MGRWGAQQEKEYRMLVRADGSKLFSNLTRGNHYLFQAEGYLNNSGSGQTSEMALIWNRTLPGRSVSIGTQMLNYQVFFHCSYCIFFISCHRRSPFCSWSRSAQVPAQDTCLAWPVCLTSLVAGVHLYPAVCCVTAQTWNTVLRETRVKGKETVSAICCWLLNTARCVKSTEIVLLVLR